MPGTVACFLLHLGYCNRPVKVVFNPFSQLPEGEPVFFLMSGSERNHNYSFRFLILLFYNVLFYETDFHYQSGAPRQFTAIRDSLLDSACSKAYVALFC
ncbi:hypothetical protein CV198_24775 [Salmonella enterica]|nr:hypothetical protein [Salmonella enterica]